MIQVYSLTWPTLGFFTSILLVSIVVGSGGDSQANARLDAILQEPRFSWITQQAEAKRQFSRVVTGDSDTEDNNKNDDNQSVLPAVNFPITHLLYEGDMLLNNKQANFILNPANRENEDKNNITENLEARSKRQAVITGPSFPLNRWNPQKPISYYLDWSLAPRTKELIRQAINFWQDNTCLFFQEDGGTKPQVRFFQGPGCFSEVGKDVFATVQHVSIGLLCAQFAPIAHEIGHLLGLLHTHNRYDRDNWVEMVRQNIPPEMANQFEKESPAMSTTLNVNYDYGSVMHFTGYNQLNGNVLMAAKHSKYQHTMGNSYGPVFSDILMVNRYYGCEALVNCAGAENQVQCHNQGFPNPKDCSQCVCPSGFGGVSCEARAIGEGGAPFDCGSSLRSTDEYQTLAGEVEASTKGQDRQAGCHFHISAPQGRRVELLFDSLNGTCSPDCLFGAVEVKFDDLARSGARICCASHIQDIGPIKAKGNLALVSVYSQLGPRAFNLKYRTVPTGGSSPAGIETIPHGGTNGIGDRPPPRETSSDDSEFPTTSLVCNDYSPSCVDNVASCNDPSLGVTMKKFCANTCGFCDTQPVETPGLDFSCDDLSPRCHDNLTACIDPQQRPLMRRLCAFTCGLCKEREIEKEEEGSLLPTEYACNDLSPYCQTNPAACIDPQLRNLCRWTCKLCADGDDSDLLPPPEFACNDLSPRCRDYQSACGDLQQRPIMRRLCAWTCGLCADTEEGSEEPPPEFACNDLSPNCQANPAMCTDTRLRGLCRWSCGLCAEAVESGLVAQFACNDRSPQCNKAACNVTSLRRTMRRLCPWTCGLCAEPEEPENGDKDASGVTLRDCADDSSRCGLVKWLCDVQGFRVGIRKICPLTCGLCVVGEKLIPKPVESSNDGGAPRLTPLNCFDRSEICISTVALCNDHRFGEAIRTTCPHACGLCPGVSDRSSNSPLAPNFGSDIPEKNIEEDADWKSKRKLGRSSDTLQQASATGNGACGDYSTNCPEQVNQCRWNAQVALGCPKTCGFCDDTSIGGSRGAGANGGDVIDLGGGVGILPTGPFRPRPFDPNLGLGLGNILDGDSTVLPGNDDQSEDCRDTMAHCDRMLNLCTDPIGKQKMKLFCRRTCGQCGGSDISLNNGGTQLSFENTLNSTGSNGSNVPLSCSSPDNANCPLWRSKGLCKLFFMEKAAREFCPNSCGFCLGQTPFAEGVKKAGGKQTGK